MAESDQHEFLSSHQIIPMMAYIYLQTNELSAYESWGHMTSQDTVIFCHLSLAYIYQFKVQ